MFESYLSAHAEPSRFRIPGIRGHSLRVPRGLDRALLLFAAVAFADVGFVEGDRFLFDRIESRRFTLLAARREAALAAGETAPREPGRRAPHELVGRLEIPALRLSALVVDGTDEATLRRGVGRMVGSALPGDPGNVVLAGHRDTDFRALRRLHLGDRIELRTLRGTYDYAVESMLVVAPGRIDVLAARPYATVTLLTCFPFHYLGPAPYRFVVRARQLARAAPRSSTG